MSTTSQKHHTFVSEPMSDKPVTALAGIGEVIGKRLTDAGFEKVSREKLVLVTTNKVFYFFLFRPTLYWVNF